MGRPLRNSTPGVHHVVARGNNKQPIYLDDCDRLLFCDLTNRIAKRFGWSVLAYVLMRNHYHLVVEVFDESLSDGMHDMNHAHAITFNSRHERINHLFGKRFWNRQLLTAADVRNAARYVVQNPMRAGGSGDLASHQWSSYTATVGQEFGRIAISGDDLLRFFGWRRRDAIGEFEAFCRQTPLKTELDEPRPVPGTVT